MTVRSAAPSGWLRPASVDAAARAAAGGATVVGGAAALGSAAFPPDYGPTAVDLEGVGLDVFAPPRLGAMVRLEQLAGDVALAVGWPVVAEAARATATPEVRRVATVGGTVAAGLPASDCCLALCAAEAAVRVVSGDGTEQRLPLEAYLARRPAGVVVEVELGPPAPGAYRRLANRAGFAPALAAVAGVVLDGAVSLWAGAVSDRPFRIAPGRLPDATLLRNDAQASSWYRRHVLEVLVEEVAEALRAGAREEEP